MPNHLVPTGRGGRVRSSSRSTTEDIRRSMAARTSMRGNDIHVMMEQQENWKELCARKWAPYVEGLQGQMKRDVALLLENELRWLSSQQGKNPKRFFEDLTTGDIATFDKYAFPIIRALFPQLAATELVSVQPMNGPSSLIFFMDFVAGSTKGRILAGDKLFETPQPSYTSGTVDTETLGTGDAIVTDFDAVLAWIPVLRGTITVTAGAITGIDNGVGGITGTGIAAGSTINYTTGAIAVNFSVAPASGVAVTVTYDYQQEGHPARPLLDIVLSKTPIVAEERSVRARWSFEAQQDLYAVHGLDAQVELLAELTTELRFEIDMQIIAELWAAAYDPPVTELVDWNKNPAPGVSWRDHKESFKHILISGANLANRRSARFNPNWIVVGYSVLDVIEDIDGFTAAPGASFQGRGVRKVGTVGRWDVYLNPAMDLLPGGSHQSFLMGYKGTTMMDTGYVYAPYVPLYTTPAVTLDDFVVRQGAASRYGSKLVNSGAYLRGRIIES